MDMKFNRGNGSVIAIVVIILVLLIGGFYAWKTRKAEAPTTDNSEAVENQVPSDAQTTAQEQSLNSQSNSDDLGSIETDLNSNNYSNL